jgi:hypothetical protein
LPRAKLGGPIELKLGMNIHRRVLFESRRFSNFHPRGEISCKTWSFWDVRLGWSRDNVLPHISPLGCKFEKPLDYLKYTSSRGLVVSRRGVAGRS